MSSQLGPIDISCDAPPYPIVRAGRRIGLESPEDVRWCRVHPGLETLSLTGDVSGWKSLFGLGGRGKNACTCGQPLPVLEKYTFTFLSGQQASYLLGQCLRCRTVYWNEA